MPQPDEYLDMILAPTFNPRQDEVICEASPLNVLELNSEVSVSLGGFSSFTGGYFAMGASSYRTE